MIKHGTHLLYVYYRLLVIISVWSQAWMPGGLAQCTTTTFSKSHRYASAFRKVWQNGNCRQQHFTLDCYCDACLYFCSLTGLFDGLLVGDETYTCQSFLMTPYPDPETKPQHDFNMALNQTRLKIDTTLAILKARFNCLRDLRVSPERASQIVGACVVLHNIATIRKERVPNEYDLTPDDVDPITLDHPTGEAVRDAITAEYFTEHSIKEN